MIMFFRQILFFDCFRGHMDDKQAFSKILVPEVTFSPRPLKGTLFYIIPELSL